MTLSLAWVRSIGDTEELVMTTDSRLRGGYAWDGCPKILQLPRSDCAICYAGDTSEAYPLMLQGASSIDGYPKSRSRALDLRDTKGHLLRVFNGMLSQISDLPKGQNGSYQPSTKFLFGGFNWRRQQFELWVFHYDPNIGRFTYRPAVNWSDGNWKKKFVAIGDYVPELRSRVVSLLKERGKLTTGGLDMEPFESLRDMLRTAGHYPLIGGAPQMVKVYRHLNTVPFAVNWPSADSGHVTITGRRLLSYEVTRYPILDPDTLTISDGRQQDQQTATDEPGGKRGKGVG